MFIFNTFDNFLFVQTGVENIVAGGGWEQGLLPGLTPPLLRSMWVAGHWDVAWVGIKPDVTYI